MVFMLGILCLLFNMQISLNALLFPPPGLSTTEDDFWRGQSRANVNNAGRWGPNSPGNNGSTSFQQQQVPEARVGALSADAPGAVASRRYPSKEAKLCGRASVNVDRIKKR